MKHNNISKSNGNGNSHEKITRLRTIASLLGIFSIGVILTILSLIIKPYSELWSTMIRDIGFIFSPVAVIALLYQHFAERDHIYYLAKSISNDVLKEMHHKLGENLGNNEIVTIYPTRHAINFNIFLGTSKNRIYILTTNLQSLEMYLGILIDRARQGVSIKILTLNPTHDFLRKRFRELTFKKAKFFYDEMVTSLRHFCSAKEHQLTPEQQKNFVIKIHDSPPTMMLFISDENILMGFILQQGRARDQMHVEFDCSVQFERKKHCQCLVEHFDLLWNRSHEITEDDIDNIIWDEKKLDKLYHDEEKGTIC